MAEYCIEYEATLSFIDPELSTQNQESNVKRLFYTAILDHLHWLCNYEEESKKIRFDLLIGFNKSFNEFKGNIYHLHDEHFDINKESMRTAVKSCLKCTLPMCNDYSNIFICLDAENNILSAGVYFAEIGRNDDSVQEMLNNDFVFFHYYNETTIVIEKKDSKLPISFSFSESNPEITPHKINKTLVNKCWSDLFNRIKRSVHGTICLIVDPTWDATSDENFTDKDSSGVRILNLPSKTMINISPFECLIMDSNIDFENNYAMFVSMLNFDGVTVIDSNGFICAYNGICNLDPTRRFFGGARHQAYQQLVFRPNEKYLGVYMQSQEGEVRFHSFCDDDSDLDYFDPVIMKWTDKYQTDIKSVKEKVLSSYNKELYDMLTIALDLKETHKAYNNYYNEPQKAKELLSCIQNYNQNFSEQYIKENLHCFRHTMNALLLCYIGNMYGVSIDAQQYVNEALSYFDSYWKIYEQEKLYYDKDLLKELARPYNPYNRWISFFKDKEINILKMYSFDDYHEILQGFIQMELEENQ